MKKSLLLVVVLPFSGLLAVNAMAGGGLPGILALLLKGTSTLITPQKLNDTGIIGCSGSVEVGAQDCAHGRDVTHYDPSDGHAGFNFTKLDANGMPLADQSKAYSVTPWACVRDNVTGLTWEVKTNDGGLHDKDDTYTWYNPDSTTNGGYRGNLGLDPNCLGFDPAKPDTSCDTHNFTTRVNAAGWCGATDWRMPSSRELEGILSLDRQGTYINRIYYAGSIDYNYFFNTQATDTWSGTAIAEYSHYAWAVNMGGGPGSYQKWSYNPVILVRGGQ